MVNSMQNNTNSNIKSKNKWNILKNPWICIIAMFLGVFVGNKWKHIGINLGVPGSIYLSLLKMSVLPIIPTAIIGGLARMLRTGLGNKYLIRLIIVFAIAIIMGSLLGILAAFIGKPGINIGQASSAFLGETLRTGAESVTKTHKSGLWYILINMIPSNIFSAFSTGHVLSIIFVSVMIGGALGMSQSKTGENFLNALAGLHEAFVRILSWILYGIPLGLFCLLAGQVAKLGIEAILALSKFVIVFYIACFVQGIIFLITMRISTGLPIIRILKAIRDPLFLAFSAASSIPPVPIAIENMEKELNQPKEVVNLVIPLGVTMNRHSYVLLFSLTTIFISQLYGMNITFSQIISIILTSSLVGMATVGRSAAIAPLLAFILTPIGIPVSVAVAIFGTTGPILDPIVQMNILFGSCATASIIGKNGKTQENS